MLRFRILLSTAFAISGITATTLLQGQQSDDVKQKPVEIRKASAASSPEPDKTPTPTPKPKPKKKKATPTPTPTPKPKAKAKGKPSETPEPDADESPSPTPKKKTSPSAKAKPSETPEVADEESSAKKSPTPKAKSKSAKKKTSTAKAKPSETPEVADEESKPEKSPTPKAKPKSGKKKTSAAEKKKETPSAKAKAKKKPTPDEEESPKPTETPAARAPGSAPRAVAVPTPSAPPAPSSPVGRTRPDARSTIVSETPMEEPEQLTIEKSGYNQPRGFWSRVFGGGGGRSTRSGAGYRYLTRSVREAIDRAPADRRNPRWQMIVVHNSGTRQGNARVFDYYHKHVRHMQNGLAYHFVIGNGTSTGNGQIEVGDRWRRQINGGHVHSDYLNNISLGICLVGDFNRDQPTRAQLDCCEELIRYLRQRCGKIDNHFPIVKPHREANPPRWGTDCPGDAFPYPWFRRFRE